MIAGQPGETLAGAGTPGLAAYWINLIMLLGRIRWRKRAKLVFLVFIYMG